MNHQLPPSSFMKSHTNYLNFTFKFLEIKSTMFLTYLRVSAVNFSLTFLIARNPLLNLVFTINLEISGTLALDVYS